MGEVDGKAIRTLELPAPKRVHSLVGRVSCWIFVAVVGALPLVYARARVLGARNPGGEWLSDGGALFIGYLIFAVWGLILGATLSVAAVLQYVRKRTAYAFPTLSVVLYGTVFLLWAGVTAFSFYEDWRRGSL